VVFDPYQQQKDATRGIGMGLPICKAIVEAHGGQLWVQDRSGPGLVISFTLPVIVDPAELSGDTEQPHGCQAPPLSKG
jgi:signal transduction histidine kinase